MSLDENCIFCKILRGEIPSDKVYEDGDMLAFRDIHPQAKVHVLCVPKSHFSYLSEMGEKERGLVGKCMAKLPEIARGHRKRLPRHHQPGRGRGADRLSSAHPHSGRPEHGRKSAVSETPRKLTFAGRLFYNAYSSQTAAVMMANREKAMQSRGAGPIM